MSAPDPRLPPDGGAASVLVVDDSRLSAAKLAMAMRALGHRAEIAGNGREALRLLEERSYDVVLLDIVMPEMDGYAVLRALKADSALREVPVIVISSLDDEIGSVARAIELGAEDFLPKSFEPAILKARLDASLAQKRFRDRELDYLRDVRRLTRAAEVIEAGAFRPSQLDIDDVGARRDALGRLAVVFHALAQEIYDRERKLDQTIRTLRGILLVLAVGATFGLTPPLSRMAVNLGAPPLGVLVWVNVIGAIACLAIAACRGALPRIGLRHLRFLVLWALVLGLFHRLAILVIAKHVEASLIALVGSLRGFLVLGLAALIAIERPTLRRGIGIGLGFVAISALLIAQSGGAGGAINPWLAAALIIPVLHAVHTLLMTWRPKDLDTYATVGAMMALSALLIAPVAMARGDLFALGPSIGRLELIILALGVSGAVSLALMLDLVALAGAVFASLAAYSQTIAGVLWAMLLLDERLSPVTWIALAIVIAALWLVEPKRAGDQFTITLPPTRRREQPIAE